MPRQMAEIISSFSVRELHLSFTQGRWQLDRWGNQNAAPSGAQLVTWFQHHHPKFLNADDQFKGLVNALAGLFCSSLNFMGPSITTSPRYVFSPFDSLLVREKQL
jgi:phosphatidylinositol glycan class T